MARAKAQLKDSRNQRSKAEVIAPVAGVVARRNAEAGALTGADALFAIIKDDAVELAAEVNATDLARLRPGQTALVHLSGQDMALPSGGYGEVLLEPPAYWAALTLPETAVTYDHTGAASVRTDCRRACSRRSGRGLGIRETSRNPSVYPAWRLAADPVFVPLGALPFPQTQHLSRLAACRRPSFCPAWRPALSEKPGSIPLGGWFAVRCLAVMTRADGWS